jgi:hypothetical protein
VEEDVAVSGQEDEHSEVIEEKGLTTRQKLIATAAVVLILTGVILVDGLMGSIGSGKSSGDRRVCDAFGTKDGVAASIGNVLAWCSGILYFWSRYSSHVTYFLVSLKSMKTL